MESKFYIQMFSVHGLLRCENPELGRDADTGGQIKYVIELGEALGNHDAVEKVDLFTRLISDDRVSEDYSCPIEDVTDNFRIVRIQCGGKQYKRKELLWPYLDEYIDRTIKFIQKEGRNPDIVHGHYPDAGYVGMHLSQYFGTPFVFTGHSLGRPKKQKLQNEGMKEERINKIYNMERRISTEEEIIKNADLIVTSTNQEIEKQYGMYFNKNLASYAVIPPGVQVDRFYSIYQAGMPDFKPKAEYIQAHQFMLDELDRFLRNPEKPLILALCRADKRKNISGLVEAYGRDKELQAIANLAIFAGIRKDITKMEDNEKDVLTEMLLLMDKYDLYGKMAIPKKHDASYEVPELYRIAAENKGVFVNIALTEPFGLTLIEAASAGLPIVATNDGGPKDIVGNCKNGILVEPTDPAAVAEAVKSIIIDHEQWKTFSANGIKGIEQHYTWEAHVDKYVEKLQGFSGIHGEAGYKKSAENPIGDRLTRLQHLIITDIDNTLIGDKVPLKKLMKILEENRETIGFGVATGRTIDSTLEVFEAYGLIEPDVIISSVGTELYYRDESFPDKGWQAHISKNWDREKIKNILDRIDFLSYQEEDTQREYKISYFMDPGKDRIPQIHERLLANKCHYNLVYSHDAFLDILPHRASKGKAIRYLSYKWEIPLHNIIVCGDSGNDEEMLRGNTLGVVAGNYAEDLEKLRGLKNIYFSDQSYAQSIIDGLEKYDFVARSKST